MADQVRAALAPKQAVCARCVNRRGVPTLIGELSYWST